MQAGGGLAAPGPPVLAGEGALAAPGPPVLATPVHLQPVLYGARPADNVWEQADRGPKSSSSGSGSGSSGGGSSGGANSVPEPEPGQASTDSEPEPQRLGGSLTQEEEQEQEAGYQAAFAGFRSASEIEDVGEIVMGKYISKGTSGTVSKATWRGMVRPCPPPILPPLPSFFSPMSPFLIAVCKHSAGSEPSFAHAGVARCRCLCLTHSWPGRAWVRRRLL